MWNPTVWLTFAMVLISVPVPAISAPGKFHRSFPTTQTTRSTRPPVNQCRAGNNMCDKNAYCYNTIGSYKCVCKDGFEGDGFRCRPSVMPPNQLPGTQRYSDTSMQGSSYRSIIHELIPQVRPRPPRPTYPTPTPTFPSLPTFTWWPKISSSTRFPISFTTTLPTSTATKP